MSIRSWYVISGQNQYTKAEFISVNLLKLTMWLKIDGKSFKITFDSIGDHNYAKRGEEIKCTASIRKTARRIKIVFK